jgi:putative transposase
VSTLQFIDQQRTYHPIQQLCRALDVVPSRYYAWRAAQAAAAAGKAEPA